MHKTPAQVLAHLLRINNWLANNGETWHTMTLINNWQNQGSGATVCQYRMVNMPPNSIEIRGVLNTNSGTASSRVFCTLPYTPNSGPQPFYVYCTNSVTPTFAGSCDTSGNLSIQGSAITSSYEIPIHGFISLDA